jgi:hypothetical protein
MSAGAIEIKEAPNKSRFYTIAPQEQNASVKNYANGRSPKPNRYYLFGNPNMEAVSTGYIIVGFESEPDIEAFSDRYDLQKPRRISRKFYTWIFENGGDLDDLSLAALIGANEPNIRYAKPEWRSTATTQ